MSDCRFGVSPVNYPDPDPDTVAAHTCSVSAGQETEPNWEGSEYFCFKLVGYDGLIKLERFGEFCMYSF